MRSRTTDHLTPPPPHYITPHVCAKFYQIIESVILRCQDCQKGTPRQSERKPRQSKCSSSCWFEGLALAVINKSRLPDGCSSKGLSRTEYALLCGPFLTPDPGLLRSSSSTHYYLWVITEPVRKSIRCQERRLRRQENTVFSCCALFPYIFLYAASKGLGARSVTMAPSQ